MDENITALVVECHTCQGRGFIPDYDPHSGCQYGHKHCTTCKGAGQYMLKVRDILTQEAPAGVTRACSLCGWQYTPPDTRCGCVSD